MSAVSDSLHVYSEARVVKNSPWQRVRDLRSEMRSTGHVTVTSVAMVLCWLPIRVFDTLMLHSNRVRLTVKINSLSLLVMTNCIPKFSGIS